MTIGMDWGLVVQMGRVKKEYERVIKRESGKPSQQSMHRRYVKKEIEKSSEHIYNYVV